MSKELLQQVIDSGADGDRLIDFFYDVTNNFRPIGDNAILQDERFTQSHLLGEINFSAVEKLALVTAQVVTDLSERSGKKAQYEYGKKLLKTLGTYDGGIFIFKGAKKQFRFSLIYAQYQGKKRDFSNFRRFTYFVAPGQTNKTYVERVGKSESFSSLDAIKDAFSVEKVNKEFYKQVAQYYYRLTGKDSKPRELDLPDNGSANSKLLEEFSVRLFGRIIFCWFLKHKHSPANIPLIPGEVLSSNAVTEHYYHSILERLFFEVMNTPGPDRKKELVGFIAKHNEIPFLNGGLFEPHVDDYYKDSANWALKIPDRWFKDFFELLEQYNFTIDENSTVDAEVSVDPEMMGRIFENLLAEVNPETGETARKATGSYYTPRTIVDYMVEQSLKQYLLTKTGISAENLDDLISYEHQVEAWQLANKESVVKAFKEIKILDPACGSGAFPLGILHRMIVVLEKVDPELAIWRRDFLKGLDEVVKKTVEKNISKSNWAYIRKLMIIRDSIYGVDIQPIAVEIAKLRCFLSLVVDEIVVDTETNRGIEALPNLEFKFVAANSLIGLPPAINRQVGLGIDDTVSKLKQIRDTYLRSYGDEKKKLEQEFLATRAKLVEQNINWGGKDALALQIASWNPFSYESSTWFDPEWMFGIERGFDVVIANPPYDVLNITEGQKISQELLEKIRSMPIYKIALGGKLNLFRLFIARAFHLMQRTGVLTYIVPYSLMCDSSCKSLREFILGEKQILFIEAFPERDDVNKRLFEAVKMSTCILSVGNSLESPSFPVRTHYSREISSNVPTVHLNNSLISSIDPENLSIPLMSDSDLTIVQQMLRNTPTRLSDFGRCYEGEINLTFHKKYLSSNNSLTPMIKGAAIQRYQIIDKMSQGEIQYVNSIAFLKNNTSPKSKHHEFRRIVMQGITGVNESVRLKMTIIDRGIFCGNSANYILIENPSLQEEYLLAILNSKLINWFFKLFSTNSNVNGYQVDNLPIASPGPSGAKIVALVRDVLAIAKNLDGQIKFSEERRFKEREIDQLIFDLYGLTYEEVAVVEGRS